MKAKYPFEFVEIDGEFVAVPVDEGAEAFHAVLQLNREAKDILALLAKETDEEALCRALSQKYEVDPERLSAYVHGYLGELRKAGLLA